MSRIRCFVALVAALALVPPSAGMAQSDGSTIEPSQQPAAKRAAVPGSLDGDAGAVLQDRPEAAELDHCADDRVFFDGRCHLASWFEQRFVTPGAAFVSVGGAKYKVQSSGIVITEMPNARTVVVKTISSTPHPDVKNVRWRYIGDYQVLSALTNTAWVDNAGWQHMLTTVEKSDPAWGETWWEHQARTVDRPYQYDVWGTDYCEDPDGNGIEGCGPWGMGAIPSSDGSDSGSYCDDVSDKTAKLVGGLCAINVGGAAIGASVGAAVVAIGSGGSLGPDAVTGILVGTGTGLAFCSAGALANKAIVEAVCDAATAPEPEPDPVAIERRSLAPFLPPLTACEEMGGQLYDGPPILIGGSCGNSEAAGPTEQITLFLGEDDPADDDEADDAAYEITVTGSRVECSAAQLVTADDNMCVILN